MPETVYILVRDLLTRRYFVEDLEVFLPSVYCGKEREDLHLEGAGIFDTPEEADYVKTILEDQDGPK